MKIIVEGEFHIKDQTGKTAIGLPGDVFYFRASSRSPPSIQANPASALAEQGDTITFSSPTYGLGFFCGQKAWGVI